VAGCYGSVFLGKRGAWAAGAHRSLRLRQREEIGEFGGTDSALAFMVSEWNHCVRFLPFSHTVLMLGPPQMICTFEGVAVGGGCSLFRGPLASR